LDVSLVAAQIGISPASGVHHLQNLFAKIF
jgi:hypothetical protein